MRLSMAQIKDDSFIIFGAFHIALLDINMELLAIPRHITQAKLSIGMAQEEVRLAAPALDVQFDGALVVAEGELVDVHVEEFALATRIVHNAQLGVRMAQYFAFQVTDSSDNVLMLRVSEVLDPFLLVLRNVAGEANFIENEFCNSEVAFIIWMDTINKHLLKGKLLSSESIKDADDLVILESHFLRYVCDLRWDNFVGDLLRDAKLPILIHRRRHKQEHLRARRHALNLADHLIVVGLELHLAPMFLLRIVRAEHDQDGVRVRLEQCFVVFVVPD